MNLDVRSKQYCFLDRRAFCLPKFHLLRHMQANRNLCSKPCYLDISEPQNLSPKPMPPQVQTPKSSMHRRTSLACVSHRPELPTASKDASKLHRWMAIPIPGRVRGARPKVCVQPGSACSATHHEPQILNPRLWALNAKLCHSWVTFFIVMGT